VAAFLVMLTVIGLPLGLLTLASWFAALYLAGIVVAAILGARLLRRGTATLGEFAVALPAGLVALAVATSIPILGILVRFLAVLCGLGLLWTCVSSSWKQPSPEPAPRPWAPPG